MSQNRPVYLKLRDQIAAAIIEGRYAEGAMLPSVRALAAELKRVVVVPTETAKPMAEDMLAEEPVADETPVVAAEPAKLSMTSSGGDDAATTAPKPSIAAAATDSSNAAEQATNNSADAIKPPSDTAPEESAAVRPSVCNTAENVTSDPIVDLNDIKAHMLELFSQMEDVSQKDALTNLINIGEVSEGSHLYKDYSLEVRVIHLYLGHILVINI